MYGSEFCFFGQMLCFLVTILFWNEFSRKWSELIEYLFAYADEEVVWFDVPVQVVAGLNVLDSLQLGFSQLKWPYALDSDHDHCLQAEFLLAVAEQVFQARS